MEQADARRDRRHQIERSPQLAFALVVVGLGFSVRQLDQGGFEVGFGGVRLGRGPFVLTASYSERVAFRKASSALVGVAVFLSIVLLGFVVRYGEQFDAAKIEPFIRFEGVVFAGAEKA